MTTEDLFDRCPTIAHIQEEGVALGHSILHCHIKPHARLGRTKKYIERYVHRNLPVCFKIEVEVHRAS